MLSKLKNKIKKYFITGFIVLIPIGAVFQIVIWLLSIGGSIFMINNGKFLYFIPEKFVPIILKNFYLPGIGFIFLIFIVLIIGFVGTNFLGKKIVHKIEELFLKIPFVRKIYHTVKQITEKIMTQDATQKRVVLVQYPRQGIYTIGFLTANSPAEINKKTGKIMANVFIATVPNPTTGLVYIVSKEDLIETKLTTEDALKLILSAGMAKIYM